MREIFGQNLEVSLSETLDLNFAERQSELLEAAKHTPEGGFADMVRNAVERLVQSVSGDVLGAKESIEDRIKVSKQQLDGKRDRHRSLQGDLYMQKGKEGRKRGNDEKTSVRFLIALFVILEIGGVATFCYAVKFIIPGLPWFIAAVPGLVMLAPSFCIAWRWKESPNKEKFSRRLTTVAVLLGFLTIILVAASMILAYQALDGDMSSGPFLDSGSPAGNSWVEKWQKIAAIVTILMLLVTENLFAGRTKIKTDRIRAVELDISEIEREIMEIEHDIEALENRCQSGSQRLEEIKSFGEIEEKWKADKEDELAAAFRRIVSQTAKEEMKEISQLSDSEIIQLAKLRRLQR